ncbi:AbiV family abortive infection protein [Arthrobacter sp. NPDC089319]|uniref:AbiV family abortive infection protein n=1 Tax=Arthrobacter sp. NPDC089319 TaxID=3155915 RepID=UPI003435947C
MARRQVLPANLSPAQVIALQNALLANADRLLTAALTMLERDNVPLARSLAILGMEESGKAIALHERRVRIVQAPEGELFVDQRLQDLWAQHTLKLATVHDFLVREEYWFAAEPPAPEENARVLGTIDEWKLDHNTLKQRGFYVDVTEEGDPVTPTEVADADAVRAVIGYVHQIGWQLRLGEHIEGKRQRSQQEDVPPATEDEIERMRHVMRGVDPVIVEKMLESMRQGRQGEKLNNGAYTFQLPSNAFENVGQPGYEAQDRELWALMEDASPSPEEYPEK